MTIGKRIKKIREFRGITQKQLGLELGYPELNAAIRISQYESNTRVPKKDTIIKIAKILNCNYITLYDGDDLGNAEQIMQEFFWLEETVGYSMDIFPLEKYYDETDQRILFGSYNKYNYLQSHAPIAIVLKYNLVNDFMSEWATRHREFKNKEISWEEYFEWKINWPHTCDDGGKNTPTVKWRK